MTGNFGVIAAFSAINWYRKLSLILQARIKAEKDGSVARFWLAIFYCFKVVAVTPESGGSVVKNTSAVQEILIMGRKGRNRKRSTRAMARNKFPIGELACRRRLLMSDERSKLTQLKRKVLTCRQATIYKHVVPLILTLTYWKLKCTPALTVILILFSVLCTLRFSLGDTCIN